jgi:hypothetical protein
MGLNLEGILAKVRAHVEDALAEGAQVILDRSTELVPVGTPPDSDNPGALAASGSVNKGAAGTKAVAIKYSSVYSKYIHESMEFRHPHGGGPKFLELAMLEKGSEAINKTGEVIRTVLGT